MYLSWAIASAASPAARASIYVYGEESSEILGIALFGRHVILADEGESATDAFAEVAPVHGERMIVGPRKTIERYWQRAKHRHAAPRLMRPSQPVLAVDRRTLRGKGDGVTIRRARKSEWELVARNSAEMIREELGYDPRAGSGEFAASVRLSIGFGSWWVGENEGGLCFYCNAGPQSPQTLQLQGIWTPPELRRRGIASAALYRICDRLLNDSPTLSLYVNDFNLPALRLYERLGFTQVGEFSTLLF